MKITVTAHQCDEWKEHVMMRTASPFIHTCTSKLEGTRKETSLVKEVKRGMRRQRFIGGNEMTAFNYRLTIAHWNLQSGIDAFRCSLYMPC